MRLKYSVLAVASTFSALVQAQTADAELAETVVTASPTTAPLVVTTDPKAPRQPVPAHDGADILKTIPGFSVVRKGGTDGDPVFRGMAGSRINVLMDGEFIYGGCGGRMDPPTAYVFPEAYDSLTIIKGPQTVLWGPGNMAATVLFDRKVKPFAEPGVRGTLSALAGSAARHDEVADVTAGNPAGYVRAIATNSHANDYTDGNGDRVHSAFHRWSGNLLLGWTPDRDTRIEFEAARSDGEAAYADRSMDGVKFAREGYGLRFEKTDLTPWFTALEAQIYYNYIDHVMDNYSLRPAPAVSGLAVSNPDRRTTGGKIVATLQPAGATEIKLGVDQQSNRHRFRAGKGAMAENYVNQPYDENFTFDQIGLFGEWHQSITDDKRVIAGLRHDWWRGKDDRQGKSSYGRNRDDQLTSGFVRYEQDIGGATWYAGLGHVERFPDFWEFNRNSLKAAGGLDNSSFLSTRPEKNTQLDTGVNWKSGAWTGSVSAFDNEINDFILIDNSTRQNLTRNVNARTWGGEAGLSYRISASLKADATLAYTHGTNRTDQTPLAQIPPLEARLGLEWDNQVWSAGALWRLVTAQNRYDTGKGNIAGQDLGESAGFGVLSLHGGYKPTRRLSLTAGVDNLFDKAYSEFVSKQDLVDVGGLIQTYRINEPGRTFWLKAQYKLD